MHHRAHYHPSSPIPHRPPGMTAPAQPGTHPELQGVPAQVLLQVRLQAGHSSAPQLAVLRQGAQGQGAPAVHMAQGGACSLHQPACHRV